MKQSIEIIGVSMDLGAGRRGVDMGPSAIRYADLDKGLRALGHSVTDRGDIDVPIRETIEMGDEHLRFLDPIVATLRELAAATAAAADAGKVVCCLGGDHSISLGSIAGAAARRRLSVIHVDTHPDFHHHGTTPSGNIHGMPMAALCGLGDERLVTLGGMFPYRPHIQPEHLVIVGARDIDAGERESLQQAGVRVFSMEAIDRIGLRSAMEQAIAIAKSGTDGIYVSMDLDAVDPMYAPGVGTPFPGGLTFREANTIMEMLAETNSVVGLDVVECNPILDIKNQTGELAVQLALSLFGKSIWVG